MKNKIVCLYTMVKPKIYQTYRILTTLQEILHFCIHAAEITMVQYVLLLYYTLVSFKHCCMDSLKMELCQNMWT